MVKAFLIDQFEDQFENLVQGLIAHKFGTCEDFISVSTLGGLRTNLLRYKLEGKMHPAGIGRKFDYHKNTLVRGDEIKWIGQDTTDVNEQFFLTKIELFIRYLNQSCFTAINDYEFHYAYYDVNSFYKRHLDSFRNDRARKFSFVLYLNEDWQESDGGRLSLYFQDRPVDIYPIGGRIIFFKSDEIEHEVHPSFFRPRLSIAGWLKSR